MKDVIGIFACLAIVMMIGGRWVGDERYAAARAKRLQELAAPGCREYSTLNAGRGST